MRRACVLAVLALSACTPQAMTERVGESAARSVVLNVVVNQYPRPEAEQAADCVVSSAAPAEVQALARDVGTRAGTTTLANIRVIAGRAATLQCLSGRGLRPLAV